MRNVREKDKKIKRERNENIAEIKIGMNEETEYEVEEMERMKLKRE